MSRGSVGGTSEPRPADPQARIPALRERIDALDAEIIRAWLERAAVSREVGAARTASGGTRLILSREMEIVRRFREALGADGSQVALLLLRAGRGPL